MTDSPPRNIVLIGYRGVGKSTVARRLAEQLGWEWADADVELERRAGRSIREIFERQGEPAFRDLECQVVADLCRRRDAVIALGGGAVLRPQNREAVAAAGTAVWLQATAEAVWQRLRQDPSTAARRPPLTDSGGYAEIEALLARRRPHYQQCADLQVDTAGKSPDQVVAEIVSLLGGKAALARPPGPPG